MKYNLMKLVFSVCTLMLVASCAHKEIEQRLTLKLTEENAVKSTADLGREARLLTERTPELTTKQRADLADLQTKIHTDLDGIRKESLKCVQFCSST